MDNIGIQSIYNLNKEKSLFHRYITNEKIAPLLKKVKSKAEVREIGKSVLNDSIYAITIGKGPKRVLMWSQMHGNESTTTKAIFDFLNTCLAENKLTDTILESCTLCIIPILNPDGAKAYTRVNANEIDLNRDAQQRSQPESVALRKVFETFKPDFCFNLHGQRTIFSAGKAKKSAIVSFLSPAQDEACSVTPNRKIAMEIIAEMNRNLQEIIPNHVGVYDDAFNLNCVGDTFQSENIPTILFEAGHFPDDYAREKTRELIYLSYMTALHHIATNDLKGDNYEAYFDIPENEKLFYDVIIRNAKTFENEEITDIGIQFEERLMVSEVKFVPIVKKVENLSGFHGHKELDANGAVVLGENDEMLKVGNENVCVKLNNEEIAFFSK
ncbi:peptidase M14 [Hyunsoonleella sp. SJ7]|uniref:Peptidase M14 n=1 Tax=Hyunsoonleella aquatilis TaxID=2762758 RepID=A0A923HD72_9FLAO|nr:M14 metallopeptidase family protein [Hyunsoonleella aquatilis]MBC3758996.1 peptidase M14 [Hyunsoonleella aquatilis]